MRELSFAILAGTMLTACAERPNLNPYKLVLTVSASGAVESGSKVALDTAIRSGTPVRVSWGLDFDRDGKADVEHWADASFISIYKGEVFAQLAPIQQQNPHGNEPKISLATQAHPWTAMLDTTGLLQSYYPNEAPKEVRVPTRWYVLDR